MGELHIWGYQTAYSTVRTIKPNSNKERLTEFTTTGPRLPAPLFSLVSRVRRYGIPGVAFPSVADQEPGLFPTVFLGDYLIGHTALLRRKEQKEGYRKERMGVDEGVRTEGRNRRYISCYEKNLGRLQS